MGADIPVSLRVRHPSMSADVIEQLMGRQADVKWTAGDARQAPNGRSLGGVRDESYCAFRLPQGASPSLDAAVVELSQLMESRAGAWPELAENGAKIEVYATLDPSAHGQTIKAETLAVLARMRAGLSIDWCS